MAEDCYQQWLESMLEGIYYVDRWQRIQYWNKAAEQITGYDRSEVLDSVCSQNLLRHIDDAGNPLCLMGCPLSATLQDGQPRSAEVYLHHKQGHRVPVTVHVTPVRDAEGQIIGALEVFSPHSMHGQMTEEILSLREQILRLAPQAAEAEQELFNLRQQAYTDPLTGLANRRYGEQIIEQHLHLLRERKFPIGIIFFDIDHFKHFNDTYGHATGDQVLRAVSQSLLNILRRSDTLCRWGGEEFLVLAPNVEEKSLLRLAERARIFVQHSFLVINDQQVSITASFGATMATPEDSPALLVERADALMYQSKQNGRNRITFA